MLLCNQTLELVSSEDTGTEEPHPLATPAKPSFPINWELSSMELKTELAADFILAPESNGLADLTLTIHSNATR